MKRWTVIALLIALLIAVVGSVSAQQVLLRVSGTLSPGDGRRSDGAWEDVYTFAVTEGTLVEVVARSESVDTYIEALMPDGTTVTNDDYLQLNAGFLRRVAQSGLVTVRVSPLFSGVEGAYQLEARSLRSDGQLSVGQSRTGRLDPGGESQLVYALDGEAGERVVISLSADGFDPLLIATDSAGRTFRGISRDGRRTQLAYLFERDASLLVTVAGVGASVRGSWTLSAAESSRTILASFDGRLDPATSDRAYDGTLFASHTFEGVIGQPVEVVLHSQDFDAVLFVSTSDGRSIVRNDDGGEGSDSLATLLVPEDGVLRLFATPFFDGSGSYTLTIYGDGSRD